ncbi:4Fe-4S dicluster domain-containing protein [Streptomyces sp. NPDC006193]|uniref:4Fe-4S dicluster domain-containing protein n=1 Tax=Streptomyces sp. NPDC006193 TaxID=3155717 RepID=UPI0033B9A029
MTDQHSLYGPLADPAGDAGHREHPPRVGFFTDTSVCIGCKACEVACKEWNDVPGAGLDLLGMSFDNTGALGADAWRHVAFIEQDRPPGVQDAGPAGLPTGPSRTGHTTGADTGRATGTPDEAARGGGQGAAPVDLPFPSFDLPGAATGAETRTDFRWLMSSDVCKHCTHAGCLDVCPTGALFRTEFGSVVVQPDICNGCGYCVSGCPYGVIDRRPGDGRAWKCTLCYDRLRGGLEPACAKACPTDSIQFGPLDELRERADRRLQQLHEAGVEEARLYGRDPGDGVGGDGAFFLLLDEPEVYGLPPDPVVPTRDLPSMWKYASLAASALLAAAAAVFVTPDGKVRR